jgi:hypothetical protein
MERRLMTSRIRQQKSDSLLTTRTLRVAGKASSKRGDVNSVNDIIDRSLNGTDSQTEIQPWLLWPRHPAASTKAAQPFEWPFAPFVAKSFPSRCVEKPMISQVDGRSHFQADLKLGLTTQALSPFCASEQSHSLGMQPIQFLRERSPEFLPNRRHSAAVAAH